MLFDAVGQGQHQRADDVASPEFGPPDRVSDWKRYVARVMQALQGKAHCYEVWNEPDAGYLATGSPIERSDATSAAAPGPYQDNNEYWLGDRYVPLAMAAREVADGIDKDLCIIGPSWNHDYHGTRGDLCFGRGLAPYLQQYSFHAYTNMPHSYAAWEHWTQTYFSHVDKVFAKHKVDMPIAVTEWGIQTFDKPAPADGFAARRDGQAFLVKSAVLSPRPGPGEHGRAASAWLQRSVVPRQPTRGRHAGLHAVVRHV